MQEMCKKLQCIKCNWCSDATVFMSTSLGVQWTLKLLVADSYHRGLNHTRHLPLMHIFLVPALQGVPSITMSLIITEKNLFSGLQCNWQGVSAAKKKHDVVTKPKVKCSRRTIICLELYKKNIWQDLSQYSLSLQNKIVTFVKDIICLAKPRLDT